MPLERAVLRALGLLNSRIIEIKVRNYLKIQLLTDPTKKEVPGHKTPRARTP